MHFFSNFVPNFIGVYLIYNGFFDCYYIGISLDMGSRLIQHKNDLEADRHDNSLMQLHYNKMKELEIDVFKYIVSDAIFIKPLLYILDPVTENKLQTCLENLEKCLIEWFKNHGYKVYNMSRFTKSNVEEQKKQVEKETEEALKRNPQFIRLNNTKDISSDKELITNKNQSINSPKCVEIDKINVFPTINQAANFLGQDPMKFKRMLNSGKYSAFYRYISYEEFLAKKKVSSEKNIVPGHAKILAWPVDFNPNSNSAKFVIIKKERKSDQYFSSIKDAAVYLNENYLQVSRWLNKPSSKPKRLNRIKLDFTTLQDFLINSPPISDINDEQSGLATRRAQCVLVTQEQGYGAYPSIALASASANITDSKLQRSITKGTDLKNFRSISLAQYQEILKFGIDLFKEKERIS